MTLRCQPLAAPARQILSDKGPSALCSLGHEACSGTELEKWPEVWEKAGEACEGEGASCIDVSLAPLHPSVQSPIVTQFFPSVLLWAFTVTLPLIVYLSAFLEAHWTR